MAYCTCGEYVLPNMRKDEGDHEACAVQSSGILWERATKGGLEVAQDEVRVE